MKALFARLLFSCCCLLLLLTIRTAMPAQAAELNATAGYGPLQELLVPSFDYGDWFKAQTGFPTTATSANAATYFGAYALAPVGNTLYLGFGSGRPADIDGALLAATDGVAITAIYAPTEQGFIDMTWLDEALFIPGADPADPSIPGVHQWDLGNTYVYTPTLPVVKHRNLENVIHAWGNWYDEASGTLYVAASSHLGDYKTWTGEVWSTQNSGSDWTRVAASEDGVGDFRTYDIIGFADRLYVIWNDVYTQPCGLAYSPDDGATWQRLAALDSQTNCRGRLLVWNNQLLVLRHDLAALFAVAANNQVTTHNFPDFVVPQWSYNNLAADGEGNLYTLTSDGRIVRSNDLNDWQTMAATDRSLIALAYWPDNNWLIAADSGLTPARLWKLDLDTASPIDPPAAPVIAAGVQSGQLQIDWADVPGVADYRLYRSASPYFAAHVLDHRATTADSEYLDNVLGDPTVNHFYRVRSVDAAVNVSFSLNAVGEFDFALVPGG